MKKKRQKPSNKARRGHRLGLVEAESMQAMNSISLECVPISWEASAADPGAAAPTEPNGDVQAQGSSSGSLKRFSMVAYTGGELRVWMYHWPVVIDLAHAKTRQNIPVLHNHDHTQIVGHSENVEVTAQRIRLNGIVSGVGDSAREILETARNGFPWQASVGFAPEAVQFVDAGETVKVNGRIFKGPINVARGTLKEVSFVPAGADDASSVNVAANSGSLAMSFEKWLQAKGFEASALTDSQRTFLLAAFEAEAKADAKPASATATTQTPPPVAASGAPQAQAGVNGRTDSPHSTFSDVLERERQEQNRIQSIDQIAARSLADHPAQIELIDKLVKAAHGDKAIDARSFELELLRSLRPIGASNIIASSRDGDCGSQVIEAAVCRSIGLRNMEKKFGERTLDACDRYFKHGIGLKQLLFRAAAANGQHFDSASNIGGLLRAAFGSIQASGFSTYSLSSILSNVANKAIFDYFEAVEQSWRAISAIGRVSDFKAITGHALTGDLTYEKIGPAGEIKHGTLGEVTYSNKAETYAKMLAVTRQDIINDDLGALDRIFRRLGRGAGLKILDVFWTEFLDNSSFFTAGNNNVSTGGGSALGTADGAAIGAAEVIFDAQTDPDGNPLGVMPRILLVPPTLKNTAARWMGGQLIVTGASTTLPNVNVYEGRYRVVSSVYMENSNYTGNSAAAWYLLADPMDLPVIETVFLDGREVPFIESADADFNQLGIQFRGYHDFGVAKKEYRGGVRSAGS